MNHLAIKNILVPIDMSEASLNALETASCLAKKHAATLHLLHVEEPDYTRGVPEDNSFTTRLNADDPTELAEAIQHSHTIKVNLIRKKGHVTECIIDSALSENAGLIIMGTHGESGYRECFIGSNTYNVIKYSTIPVLMVPSKQKVTDFKKVLLPVRPTIGISLRYDFIRHFLSPGSTIEILGLSDHKTPVHPGELDKITGEMKGLSDKDNINVNMNINVNTTWGAGSTISGDVFRFAQLRNTELIVVTSILDGITRPGFIGTHVQKIINSSKVPSLIIKMTEVPAYV